MSSESAVTMGAAASKKLSARTPVYAAMASHSAGSVSGPVAMIAGASGISAATADSVSISGWPCMAAVTRPENRSRSTASAPPAGTRLCSAHARIRLPSARSSAFRRPEALDSCSAFSELEQTNSA